MVLCLFLQFYGYLSQQQNMMQVYKMVVGLCVVLLLLQVWGEGDGGWRWGEGDGGLSSLNNSTSYFETVLSPEFLPPPKNKFKKELPSSERICSWDCVSIKGHSHIHCVYITFDWTLELQCIFDNYPLLFTDTSLVYTEPVSGKNIMWVLRWLIGSTSVSHQCGPCSIPGWRSDPSSVSEKGPSSLVWATVRPWVGMLSCWTSLPTSTNPILGTLKNPQHFSKRVGESPQC